jgi:hypothetical protein
MYLERYSRIPYVKEFARQIDESIRTYFCGYIFNAVTGLLPVIEGIIRRMAASQHRDIGQGTKKLNDELQALVDRELQSKSSNVTRRRKLVACPKSSKIPCSIPRRLIGRQSVSGQAKILG